MKFTPAACCGRGECVENGTAGALFDRHVRYSTAQRQFVDVFQLVAEPDAACDGGDFQVGELPQTVHQVEERRLALDRGGDRQNHLAHAAPANALDQQVDFQVGGRDSLHGRDDAAQHMIEPPVLLRMFDREDVGHLLHDADRRTVAFRIFADRADIGVRQIVALPAITDFAAEPVDAPRHARHDRRLHAQQVHGQPQRRAAADSGEFGQLLHHVGQ